MLNICIDIDGTLTEPYYWLAMVNAYFGKDIKPEDITEYEIHKVMDISREDYLNFYQTNKYIMHGNPELREKAVDYINLMAAKHHVHFVTAREKELSWITSSYLKRYNISYENLYVTGTTNKVAYAKQLHSDIFIEDCLSNALLLSKAGFKVLLMDTEYNRCSNHQLHPLIARVTTWQDLWCL